MTVQANVEQLFTKEEIDALKARSTEETKLFILGKMIAATDDDDLMKVLIIGTAIMSLKTGRPDVIFSE